MRALTLRMRVVKLCTNRWARSRTPRSSPRLPSSLGGPNGRQGNVKALLLFQGDLAVPFPALNAVLQHHQGIERLFRPRRTTRNVDIHRNHLIRARHDRIVLVEATCRCTDPEGDHPLGLAHLVVNATKNRRLPLGDGAHDDEQVRLARGKTREFRPKSSDIVLGRPQRHEFHPAACGDEGILKQRIFARPVDRVGKFRVVERKWHFLAIPSR